MLAVCLSVCLYQSKEWNYEVTEAEFEFYDYIEHT